jgi:hypothetical protein
MKPLLALVPLPDNIPRASLRSWRPKHDREANAGIVKEPLIVNYFLYFGARMERVLAEEVYWWISAWTSEVGLNSHLKIA